MENDLIVKIGFVIGLIVASVVIFFVTKLALKVIGLIKKAINMINELVNSPSNPKLQKDISEYVKANKISFFIRWYKMWLLNNKLNDVLSKSDFSKNDEDAFIEIARKLGVDAINPQMAKIDLLKRRIIQQKLSEMGADFILTDEEEREFFRIVERIGAELNNQELSQLEKLRKYTAAITGKLSPIHSPYQLNKDESLYFMTDASYNEIKQYKGRGKYATPYTEMQLLDRGSILLTNRRILFVGAFKTLSIKFEKILEFKPYKDGVQINKGTAKPAIFMFNDDPILFTLIYNARNLYDNTQYDNKYSKDEQTYHKQEADIALDFCFEILGLTPSSSKDEVLAAYREAVKRYHPDKGGDGHFFSVLTKAKNKILETIL